MLSVFRGQAETLYTHLFELGLQVWGYPQGTYIDHHNKGFGSRSFYGPDTLPTVQPTASTEAQLTQLYTENYQNSVQS